MSLDPAIAPHIPAASDRRVRHRYPVTMALTYRVSDGDQTGAGQTLNMSSGGLCCSGIEQLAAGTLLEISLKWPVLLEGCCPMKMVIEGRVLRSDAGRTAIAILRYQFYTQRRDTEAEHWNSSKAFKVA